MNKFIAFVLSFLLFSHLTGQSVNRAYHTQSESPDDFICEKGGRIFFASTQNNRWYGFPVMYLHDLNGQLTSSVSIPYTCYHKLKSAASVNGFLTVGYHSHCSDIGQSDIQFLQKINFAGQTVFTSTYVSGYNQHPDAIVECRDSTILVFTGNTVHFTNYQGNYTGSVTTLYSMVSSALLLPDASILLSCAYNSAPVLARIDSKGNVLSTIAGQPFFRKMQLLPNGEIAAVSAMGFYHRYTAQLQPVHAAPLVPNTNLVSMAHRNDTIFGHLWSPFGSAYVVVDSAYKVIQYDPTITSGIRPADMCLLSDNKMAILSTANSAAQEHVSLNITNAYAGDHFSQDLEMVDAELDTMHAQRVISNFVWEQFRLRCTVKNTGSVVVNGFQISCPVEPPFNYGDQMCDPAYYNEDFPNVTLQPGATATVTTKMITSFPRVPFTIPIFTPTYCPAVSRPSFGTDLRPENDTKCFETIVVIAGLKTSSPSTIDFAAYPSPFSTEIAILCPENANVTAYDALGRKLRTWKHEPGKNLVSTTDWNPGIYFISLQNEHGSVTQRLVKMTE